MVVGRRRGCAVIVHGPQGARASQLIAGVRRTVAATAGHATEPGRWLWPGRLCYEGVPRVRGLAPLRLCRRERGRRLRMNAKGNGGGAFRPWGVLGAWEAARAAPARSLRARGAVSQHWGAELASFEARSIGETTPPNKAMKLTKLSAAPWYGRHRMHGGQVPPRARAASMDAGTASQLIASVRLTRTLRARGRRVREDT